jgi:hypothetical protein
VIEWVGVREWEGKSGSERVGVREWE